MSGCGIPPGGKIGIRHDSRSAHRFVGGPPVGCLRKFVVGDIPAYAAAWLQFARRSEVEKSGSELPDSTE
jgi:hypothetical protein